MKTIKLKIWPRTLKHTLLLAMALLVLLSGVVISQSVIHRYRISLTQEAIARAEKITHNLALDAADKILINDLVGLQKLLDDQMASESAIGNLFVVRDGRILARTFNGGVPVELIQANDSANTQKHHLQRIISDRQERYIDFAWPGNVRELENRVEHTVVLAKQQVIEPGDLPAFLIDAVENAQPLKQPQTITRMVCQTITSKAA